MKKDTQVTIDQLVDILTAIAKRCRFIPGRINRQSVSRQLKLLGSGLRESREGHRQTVDRLLSAALFHSSEQSTAELFQQSLPIHLALVFDRLLAAQHVLQEMKRKHSEPIPFPIPPEEFVQGILLHQFDQFR